MKCNAKGKRERGGERVTESERARERERERFQGCLAGSKLWALICLV